MECATSWGFQPAVTLISQMSTSYLTLVHDTRRTYISRRERPRRQFKLKRIVWPHKTQTPYQTSRRCVSHLLHTTLHPNRTMPTILLVPYLIVAHRRARHCGRQRRQEPGTLPIRPPAQAADTQPWNRVRQSTPSQNSSIVLNAMAPDTGPATARWIKAVQTYLPAPTVPILFSTDPNMTDLYRRTFGQVKGT